MHIDFENMLPIIDRETIKYDPERKRLTFSWTWDAPYSCGINIILSGPQWSNVLHRTDIEKGSYISALENVQVDEDGFWNGQLAIRAYYTVTVPDSSGSGKEHSATVWSKSDSVSARTLAMTPKFLNESGNDFVDISSEASRTYNFGQKGFVKINKPLKLSVSSSGGHRIFTADGQSHYVPAGWIHLSWVAKDGEPHFVK